MTLGSALLLSGVAGAVPAAQSASLAETAGFLLNFAKFTQWPGPGRGPLVFCSIGSASVADALRHAAKGRTVNGRMVTIRSEAEVSPLPECHALYITGLTAPDAVRLADAVKGLPVLTISDADGFAARGGMIELNGRDRKTRFAINTDAAKHSRILLNAQLLALARIVKETDAR